MSDNQPKFNIDEALAKDNYYQEGLDTYKEMSDEAIKVAEEITSTLIESIVKKTDAGEKANSFTITTAILAVSKALTNLTSYLHEDEVQFMGNVKKARELVASKIFPVLLDPKPCGLCQTCKNGKPEECLNPSMEIQNTETKFLPIIANMIVEYDIWAKVMYLHTEGRKIMPEKAEEKKDGNQ